MAHHRNCIELLACIAVALAAAAPPAVHGESPTYIVTELGTLGGPQSVAYGLNNLNQVVGASNVRTGEVHAFQWSDGTMADLGTLGGTASRAWAINDAGVIIGESLPTGQTGSVNYRAFIYENRKMTPLSTLGGTWSVAYDISETGVIAGLSYNTLQQEKAVTWTGGVITNIAQAGGSTAQRSRAYGINDLGDVAGWEYTPLAGPNDAFRYSGGQWLQIGGFGVFQNSEAYDVGNSGIVVGSSAPPAGGDWHAALWLPANPTEAVIVGTLPGFPLAELNDLNGQDVAVGRAYFDASWSRAIYFDGRTLHDLNDFLPDGFQGVLFDSREINENGVIAATALDNGLLRAVLLSPETCPTGTIAECADLDSDGIRDDNCVWWTCAAAECQATAIVFADMGGAFGECPPDGTADGNDRFHALNCFSNAGTTGAPNYPCEDAPPQAYNVDAGGPFGDCQPDGVCDGNDAFHALNAFQGSTTCLCPSVPAPARSLPAAQTASKRRARAPTLKARSP